LDVPFHPPPINFTSFICIWIEVGRLKDQAELSGVLNSLYELHLPIVKVETVKDD
jgi:hypothetical protein